MKKKLIEMYGLKEGPFDDLNKQLGSAKSVARDPRAPQQRARVGQSGDVQKAQADLDQSKSVFDEAAGEEVQVSLAPEEIDWIVRMAQRSQGTAWAYGNDKAPEGLADKLNAGEKSGSSASMSVSKKTPFGGGM